MTREELIGVNAGIVKSVAQNLSLIHIWMPTAAAQPKQMSWRLVRFRAILVFTFDRSLGTFT